MPLNKANHIIEDLRSKDSDNCPQNLKCWIKKEEKYDIHIFSILIEDDANLHTIKDNLRDYIAIYFQSQFPLQDVERWNIYQIYFCEHTISLQTKMDIEQDKYATRKIVIDENVAQNISDDAMATLIYNKIFKFEFESTIKELPLLSDSLSESDLKIIELAATVNVENEEQLSNLVISICNE